MNTIPFNSYLRLLLLAVLVLTGYSCTTTKPYYSRLAGDWQELQPDSANKLLYTVFLIGDVGAPSLEPQEPSLKLMRAQMLEAGAQSATVFLGDNVYHNGLPEPGRSDREVSEKRLNAQLDILKGYPGEKYMIPGNHDWNHSGRGGIEAIIREENYVNAYLTEENIVTGGAFFVPGSGCPGPYEIRLSDDLVMIAIDSEWWLHPNEKPYGTNSGCGAATEVDFLIQVEDIIEKNQGSDIIVVAHHPMFSEGIHGGHFTLKDHIFPLTLLRDWMYVPLPVIGSIYPFARKYGGILQDIPHPRYQAYIQGLTNIFQKYDNIIYAAGHEHNLQYSKPYNFHHILSGSGCKVQHMKHGGVNTFGQQIKGFVKVLYYENGEAWTEYWTPEGDGSEGRIIFRTPLYAKKPRAEEPLVDDDTNYADSTITMSANTDYKLSGLKAKLLGDHYRQEWITPVEVPLLDMKNEQGGLIPYQKGGGKQTSVLKVRTPDAHEFTLRSVDKDPSLVLPAYLRETAAKALLQDQISAQHPYGALAIPPLADAAKVYHTNPRLVYIPKTPYLRQYIDEFNNMLAFLEEDADENHEEVASLGNAENLVGTDKVLRELQQDNDNRVDEQAYARARLFDMLIGDWDRHEGQWRWVERRDKKGDKLYVAVPEDRDQVFFKADGILPWMATRRWGVRNIQNFDYTFKDVVGLNLSALSADRTFTSSVTRQDWIQLAEEMKVNMTDAVIEEAISRWPENIRAISGEAIAGKLKSRREALPQVAEQYYEHISKMVDVAGSDKHERFLVHRLNDEQTQVTVLKITKEGEVRDTLYARTFYTSETREIRLYGQGGQDEFRVKGNVNKGILLRIIGGHEADVIVDSSSVSGLRKHTWVYDTSEGNQITFGPETKNRTAAGPDVNFYDRDNYNIPYLGPRSSFEYNVDDGVFIGAGLLARTHRFRKKPYAAEHLLEANYAFLTTSFNVRYTGDFRQLYRNWHLIVTGLVQGPQYQRNYYGLGNFTQGADEQSDSFYRVRFKRSSASASFYKDYSSVLKIGLGPTYDRFQVVEPGRESFIVEEARAGRLRPDTYDLKNTRFNAQHYLGLAAFADMDVIGDENKANPRIGMRWHNKVSYNQQVLGERLSFANISSDFSFYISPNFPLQLTWAGRIGAAHNFGDFRFYQANTLGGTDNLRGYRRTRYSGRSALYGNAEARLQLFDFTLASPGRIGALGIFDAGRVYNEGDRSESFFKSLHTGIGGGVWIDMLQKNVITFSYVVGQDNKLFMLDFGFLF